MSPPSRPFDALKSVFIRVHNPIVRRNFDNRLSDNSITTPAATMKWACLVHETDSATMILLRLFLYYIICQGAANLQAPIYGIPAPDYGDNFKYKPQIKLFFNQKKQDIHKGYSAVHGIISFRLPNETSETLTEAKLKILAERIERLFCPGNKGIAWHKGSIKLSYKDSHAGIDTSILVSDSGSGKTLLTKILEITNQHPRWENLTEHRPEKHSQQTSGYKRVLGKSVHRRRYRPRATVYFRYADIVFDQLPHGKRLVDITGKRALVF